MVITEMMRLGPSRIDAFCDYSVRKKRIGPKDETLYAPYSNRILRQHFGKSSGPPIMIGGLERLFQTPA
jgi:hypothetical protein